MIGLAALVVVMCWALGFLSGQTYAEANLGRRVRDVRRARRHARTRGVTAPSSPDH